VRLPSLPPRSSRPAGSYTPPGAAAPCAALAVLRLASAGAAALSASAAPADVEWLGCGEGEHAAALPAGAALLRAAWHPASEGHLAVLLSDGRLRLYAPPAGGAGGGAQPRLLREQELALCEGGGGGAPPPVDFALPPAGRGGWDGLSALLLYADGALRSLCPAFAPFGSHLSSAALGGMAAAARARGDAAAAAWLAAAYPPAEAGGGGGGGGGAAASEAAAEGRRAAAAAGAALARCAPHAYPAAGPPLLARLAGPPAGGPQSRSLALAPLPAAPGGGVLLAVGLEDGAVRLALLLAPQLAGSGLLRPRFAHAPAHADREVCGRVRRLRASPAHEAWEGEGDESNAESNAESNEDTDADAPILMPIDELLLGVPPPPPGAGGGLRCAICWEAPPGRRLFLAAGGAAAVATLSWLPQLHELLCEAAAGRCGGAGAAPLPLPLVEPLRVTGGPACAGACLARARGEGAARLLLLLSDGGLSLLAPAPAAPLGCSGLEGEEAEEEWMGDEVAALAAAVERLAGGAPRAPPPPPQSVARLGLEAAGAAEALASGAAALRAAHCAWAHRAHSELGRLAVRLGGEGARQAALLRSLQRAAGARAERAEALSRRLETAEAMQANLAARGALLAELASELPLRAAAEEGLSRQLEGWRAGLPALAGRVAELRARAQAAGAAAEEAGAGARAAAAAVLPAAQLRRLQAVLEESGSTLARSLEELALLQAAEAEEAEAEEAS